LQLFTEALRVPDFQTQNGNIIVSDWIPVSRREIQPLNGRPEKIQKTLTKYFYVNDEKPSGIPNAFVVSKDEAVGSGELKN